ncbi:MAG: hypothetical protein VX424_02175 [Actinomycetota bacterium]|nr:hypothetical protein [Actinomycetota bacterium]
MIAETKTTKTPTAKVIVEDPFRIVHETTAYTSGDEITVDGVTAARWERAGWVRRAPATSSKASTKS